MPLIIIESPNKIAKIRQITGYSVIATVGHFMDLIDIEIENSYNPIFDYSQAKKKSIMEAINKAKGQEVYIASDPDREGYAIGYMFYQKIKNVAKTIYRAEFHEITPSGIKKGLSEAKLFSDTNFNYYQAFLGRRCCDRLVGFILSPLLTKAISHNKYLSAGRVQTPALSLITNREEEIAKFNALSDDEKKEYALQAISDIESKNIAFKHIEILKDEDGKERDKEIKFASRDEAQKILDEIISLKQGLISKITKAPTKTNPPKPFTTSKLLKVASKKLGLPTDEIQKLAQGLFESGLITYIRTDSESLSKEFLDEAKAFYENIYPNTYLYTQYSAGKNSQAEAHEAIRITHCHKYEDLQSICAKEGINNNGVKLYDLIFKNTILSQSKPATYEQTSVFLKIKMTDFKVSFKKIIDKGFLGVFDDSTKEAESNTENEQEINSFPYKEGDLININEISIKQIDKKPPRRYLEADFIEVLEKTGIGRPSTYASFLPILLKREYIEISKDKKREIIPTKLGISAIAFFKNDKNAWILDLNFTKEMEDKLDEICDGKQKYIDFMKNIHAKMDFMPLKQEKGDGEKKQYPASQKQIDYCKNIAEKLNIPLPQGFENDYKIAGDFISKNASKMPKDNNVNGNKAFPPSPKQLNFAKSIAQTLNIDLPQGIEQDYKIAKAFIDENISKMPKKTT